jgi:SAM-dependent methyltransferase
MMSMPSTAIAFEELAPTYDVRFGENPIARRLRSVVWDTLFSRLGTPATVVDLGCGTGIDACEMAARGYQVLACDGAEAMLREVERKRRLFGLEASLDCRRVDLNEPGSRRTLFSGPPPDAVLANFGVFNCVGDLTAFGADLARWLRPGSLLLAVVMGKFCPWDVAYHLLRGRFRRAFERLSKGEVRVNVAGRRVPVHYYRPATLKAALGLAFHVRLTRALGFLLPPPYLTRRTAPFPRVMDRLARWEERWGDRWPVAGLGDHFLMLFERRS